MDDAPENDGQRQIHFSVAIQITRRYVGSAPANGNDGALESSVAVAEQDCQTFDVMGEMLQRDGEVEVAVAVQIHCGQSNSPVVQFEIDRRGKRAVTIPEQDRNFALGIVIGTEIGDREVEFPVFVQIRNLNPDRGGVEGETGRGAEGAIAVAEHDVHRFDPIGHR